MEKFSFTEVTSLAKLIGTVVSLEGAIVVVLYKGNIVIATEPVTSSISLSDPPSSPEFNWVLGGGLLAASYLLVSVWFILQARIMNDYPAELFAVLFFNLSCRIVSAPVGLIGEPNLSAWMLKPDIGLIAILYSGIVGSVFGNTVHIWGLHFKGLVYVALFKPLSIAIAAFMGVLFLRDSLYLGSIIGATIISTSFYIVIWEKAREDVGKDQVFVHYSESSLSTFVESLS